MGVLCIILHREVSATRPDLRAMRDYLGNILRVGELERIHFVLKYGSMGRTVHENGRYAHENRIRDNRLRLCRRGRGIIVI